MADALIGYSGFVGSNLLQQRDFEVCYNSKNFLEMEGRDFDLMVCCGLSAAKWLANKDPEKDLAHINALRQALSKTRAKHFILISTIDVYPRLSGVNEDDSCSNEKNHPYGTHRKEFEVFCQNHFPNCIIIRLPGLFGDGLKKNVIFDLLNSNCLEMINPKSQYQYYYLGDLWRDINRVLEHKISLINFCSEPIASKEIIEPFFPNLKIGGKANPEQHYDIQTLHAKAFGGTGTYINTKHVILEQLGRFIDSYKVKK